jgi:hypothetical protein
MLSWPGAGWHQRGDKLSVPGQHHVATATGKFPELNPMDVWDYLRGNKLSHTVWNTYEAIVEVCANARRFLIDDLDRIRSIPIGTGHGSTFKRAGRT